MLPAINVLLAASMRVLLVLICLVAAPNDDVCDATAVDVAAGTTLAFDNRGAVAQTDEVSPGAGANNCGSTDGQCYFFALILLTFLFLFE